MAKVYLETSVNNKPSVKLIERVVCDGEKVSTMEIHEESQERRLVLPRQVIMSLACGFGYTQAHIAVYYLREHCTAIHAIKTINNLCDTDSNFKKRINGYKNEIIRRNNINISKNRLNYNHFMIVKNKLKPYVLSTI